MVFYGWLKYWSLDFLAAVAAVATAAAAAVATLAVLFVAISHGESTALSVGALPPAVCSALALDCSVACCLLFV